MQLHNVQTHLKRTLTGIVAASMVLGSFAPAALAATSSSKYSWSHRAIENNGTTISALKNVPGFTYNGTYYISVYDVQYLLNQLGFTSTWDNGTLNIQTTNTVDSSKLPANQPSGANAFIQVNGKQVFKGNRIVVTPPGGKFATSFMQVFDLQQVLNALGFNASDYEGSAGIWNIVPPAAQAGALAITGAPTSNIAVNTPQSLGLTNNGAPVTQGVTWTVDNSGAVVDNNGNFVATKAGTYNVTASYEGKTVTTKIVVYGAAAGVQLAPTSSTLVANGVSTDTITATVVDANGNTVSDYNGTVDVYLTTSSSDTLTNPDGTKSAGNVSDPIAYTAKNGTVTITLNSGGSTTGTDTIYAGVPGAAGVVSPSDWTSTAVSVVAPVPAAVAFGSTAPTAIDSNVNYGTNYLSLPINVVDQSGNPIAQGNTTATVTVAGPATLSNGLTTDSVTLENGSGTVGIATNSNKTTGPITITVSVPGLGSVTKTLTAYVGGAYSQIALASAPANTSFTADQVAAATSSPFLTYKVDEEDANGNIADTGTGDTVSATVTGPSGASATDVTATPTYANGVETIALTYRSGKVVAGTYKVTISDSSHTSIEPLTETFTVTPGAPYDVTVKPMTITVPASNPSGTVSAQLVDQFGNVVKESGVVVDFTAGGTYAPTLSASSVATDSNGVASVTATEPNTPSDTGTVAVKIDPNWAAGNSLSEGSGNTSTLTVASSVVTKVGVTTDKTSYSADSATPELSFTEYDSAGAPMGDNLAYTVTGPTGFTTVTGTTTGTSPVTLPALTIAGTYTVTVTDTAAAGQPSATATFTVTPGALDKFASTVNGQDATTGVAVKADTPVAVVITAEDKNGNAVTATTPLTVSLNDVLSSDGSTAGNGAFSLSQGGSPVTTVTIPAGQSSVTVYYVNANADTYDLSATYQAAAANMALTTNFGGVGTAESSGPAAYSYSATVTLTDAEAAAFTSADPSKFTLSVGGDNYTYTTNAQPGLDQFTVTQGASPNDDQYTITFGSNDATLSGATATIGYPGVSSVTTPQF
ncbi:hypothetical protein JI721_05390 [Alicyclobacillus cycloheptanicus]|uniref:Big-1 domain-containing protein n=1 Tax=Alicyclobacillus cycloheptanicus TaxID=1457 RepID=A0ABT9XGE1_9BACL|nr:hypothetical protein [Alicyclobacillus cycloheptanicus]MDQ0189370.1 hypothetical protein [Alicyclobacillus cycloheptanicus]WDM02247.1 hypothetical protein JI721_05390 [Alicyclobacillus cycloheptanicus]